METSLYFNSKSRTRSYLYKTFATNSNSRNSSLLMEAASSSSDSDRAASAGEHQLEAKLREQRLKLHVAEHTAQQKLKRRRVLLQKNRLPNFMISKLKLSDVGST